MATYNNVKKTYYTLAYGKLKRFEGNGVTSEFDGVDGIVTGITERMRAVNGEDKTFIDVNFKDGQEVFCISCEKYNNNGNTILRCLANVTDFTKKILVEAWQTEKNGRSYTNISVKQDGQRVHWVDIPEIESFQLPTGEVVKSPKKRNEFIDNLIVEINARIHGNSVAPSQPAAEDPAPEEDMPGGDIPPYGGYAPAPTEYPAYVPNPGR